MRDQQYKLSRRCRKAWGRAADAAADMDIVKAYLWDSVCSADMLFCSIGVAVRKRKISDADNVKVSLLESKTLMDLQTVAGTG